MASQAVTERITLKYWKGELLTKRWGRKKKKTKEGIKEKEKKDRQEES